MTSLEIKQLVEDVTGCCVDKLTRKDKNPVQYARYVAILMMHEEGYSHKEIKETIHLMGTDVYYALKTADALLTTNKPFKSTYLACIQRMAELEDAA